MNTYEDKYFSTNNLSHRQLGTKLQDFTLEELMIFCVSVMGALGVFCGVIMRSKCEEIACCGCKIKRNIEAIIEEEKLKLGKSTTPRKNEEKNNLNLEPETEELFSK